MAIHLMVVVALVIVILYQKSEGGALGMGQGGVFTGRGQANALTRATGILATIFFLTSIALTVIPAWQRRAESGGDWTKAIDPGSVDVKEIKPGEKGAPAAPEAGKNSIFDQLQRAQQQRQQSAPAPAPAAAPPVAPPAAEAPKAEAPKPAAAPSSPADAPKAEATKPASAVSDAPKAAAPAAAEKPAAPIEWKSPK
jgi:protein translocase SecG subunit